MRHGLLIGAAILMLVACSDETSDQGGGGDNGGGAGAGAGGSAGSGGEWPADSCTQLGGCCQSLPDDQIGGCEYDSATGMLDLCGPHLANLRAMGMCQ